MNKISPLHVFYKNEKYIKKFGREDAGNLRVYKDRITFKSEKNNLIIRDINNINVFTEYYWKVFIIGLIFAFIFATFIFYIYHDLELGSVVLIYIFLIIFLYINLAVRLRSLSISKTWIEIEYNDHGSITKAYFAKPIGKPYEIFQKLQKFIKEKS
jgi:hypothetical protein